MGAGVPLVTVGLRFCDLSTVVDGWFIENQCATVDNCRFTGENIISLFFLYCGHSPTSLKRQSSTV